MKIFLPNLQHQKRTEGLEPIPLGLEKRLPWLETSKTPFFEKNVDFFAEEVSMPKIQVGDPSSSQNEPKRSSKVKG